MSNQYKSFYFNDILNKIDHVALDAMMVPAVVMKMNGEPMTLAELSAHNSLIAMHNEGVREMANRLKDKLVEDEDNDG